MVCATDARTIDAVAVGRRMADALLQLNGGADPRDARQLLAVRQVPRATNGAAVRFPARGQRARDRDQQGSMEEKT